MQIEKLLLGKHEALREIMTRNGVRRLRVFGSYATDGPTGESDVDVLIVLEDGRDLFDLVGLKLDLEALLNRKVDVVEEGGLSPYLRDRILEQAREI